MVADRVVVNDVALEVDEALGAGDRVEPRRIVLPCVLEQPNAVARHERRARGPRERLLGESGHGRNGIAGLSARHHEPGSGMNSTSSPGTFGNRRSSSRAWPARFALSGSTR